MVPQSQPLYRRWPKSSLSSWQRSRARECAKHARPECQEQRCTCALVSVSYSGTHGYARPRSGLFFASHFLVRSKSLPTINRRNSVTQHESPCFKKFIVRDPLCQEAPFVPYSRSFSFLYPVLSN